MDIWKLFLWLPVGIQFIFTSVNVSASANLKFLHQFRAPRTSRNDHDGIIQSVPRSDWVHKTDRIIGHIFSFFASRTNIKSMDPCLGVRSTFIFALFGIWRNFCCVRVPRCKVTKWSTRWVDDLVLATSMVAFTPGGAVDLYRLKALCGLRPSVQLDRNS